MNKKQKRLRTERIKWERAVDVRRRVIPVLCALGQRTWIRQIVIQPDDDVLFIHLCYDGESILFRFGAGFCVGLNAWVEILLCKHWESMQEIYLIRQCRAMQRDGFDLVSYDSSFVLRMDLDDFGNADEVRCILETLVAKRRQLLNEFEVSRHNPLLVMHRDQYPNQTSTQTVIS